MRSAADPYPATITPRTIWRTLDLLRARATFPGLDVQPDDVDLHLLKPFAARAHARLLRAAGWCLSKDPVDIPHLTDPTARCFDIVHKDTSIPAYGFTAVVPPFSDHRCLGRAQFFIAQDLRAAGVETALLLHNTPMVRVLSTDRQREQVIIFGGWIFQRGEWFPFLVAPGGLDAALGNGGGFTPDMADRDLAEVYGHDTPHVVQALLSITRQLDAQSISRDMGGSFKLHRIEGPGGWAILCNLEKWNQAAAQFLELDDLPPVFPSVRRKSPDLKETEKEPGACADTSVRDRGLADRAAQRLARINRRARSTTNPLAEPRISSRRTRPGSPRDFAIPAAPQEPPLLLTYDMRTDADEATRAPLIRPVQ